VAKTTDVVAVKPAAATKVKAKGKTKPKPKAAAGKRAARKRAS
jgi:hypothetical protein